MPKFRRPTKADLKHYAPHVIAIVSTSALAVVLIRLKMNDNLLNAPEEMLKRTREEGGRIIYKIKDDYYGLYHVPQQ